MDVLMIVRDVVMKLSIFHTIYKKANVIATALLWMCDLAVKRENASMYLSC